MQVDIMMHLKYVFWRSSTKMKFYFHSSQSQESQAIFSRSSQAGILQDLQETNMTETLVFIY